LDTPADHLLTEEGLHTFSSNSLDVRQDYALLARYYVNSQNTCYSKALWLRQFLQEIHLLKPNPTILLCNNNGAKALSSDPTHHSRSKHIDVCHHFVREHVEDGSLTIWCVPGFDNVADIFTKALPHPDFTHLWPYLGLQ
jgi:hypothetical protein